MVQSTQPHTLLFIANLSATPFKSIPCSGPPGPEKAVARWPHKGSRVLPLVGGRRIETAGPFRFLFGHEKERPTGW